MVAKKVRNRYKRCFFILLGLNIIYFTFQFYTLPLSINQVKNYFFQFFYSPKVPTGPYIYGIDVYMGYIYIYGIFIYMVCVVSQDMAPVVSQDLVPVVSQDSMTKWPMTKWRWSNDL